MRTLALISILLFSCLFSTVHALDMKQWEGALSYEVTENREQINDLELVFCFMGGCGFCHELAPILKSAAKEHQINVMPVSADGGSVPEFENFVMDRALLSAFKVTSFPAVYLINKKTKDAYPIAVGFVDEATLSSRVEQSVNYVKNKDKHV